MRLATIFFAALITLFLGGCESVSGGAPQAAIDSAIDVVKRDWCLRGPPMYKQGSMHCKEFSVAFVNNMDLTPADKENGISEQYVIALDYLSLNDSKWDDGYTCTLTKKQNGSWISVSVRPNPLLKEQKKCTSRL